VSVVARSAPSSPDKQLWPQAGLTKQDLWDYYERIADRLLPQLSERPLTLKRFPDGLEGQGFFQKNLPAGTPADLPRFAAWAESSQRTVTYAVVRDVEHLQWCAQVAALELHPWFARTDRPERPDTLAFDLDPASRAAAPVAAAARWLGAVLDDLGLSSLVKTSGKRGLHIYVPLERRYGFDEVRGLGLAVARCCAAAHPDALTVEMRKAQRGDRLLLDWSRNGPAQTLVAAWSPRATAGATVSAPLHWDEVTDDLDPGVFTLRTAPERPDPWAAPPAPQRLERARRRLEAAGYDCADRDPRSGGPFA
jgi:bifunctional non-homologous end joining protein LigD